MLLQPKEGYIDHCWIVDVGGKDWSLHMNNAGVEVTVFEVSRGRRMQYC